jgi:hypothetical protein
MLNVSKSVLMAGLLVLPAISAGNTAVADSTGACRSDAVETSTACGRIATAQKPAIVQLPADPEIAAKPVAVKFTVRPLADGNAPYLVDVDVGDGSAAPKKLGQFSFYQYRIGETQTFVLPKPADGSPGKNWTLSVRLIPANPERDIKDIKDAAVEIVGARLVSE